MMASSALEAKINKIRQQNEEIKRRYEEVEEDKKNAAKLNALVQMVPSTDWPERKEPPVFSNPPRIKHKLPKEKHEYVQAPLCGEGKKMHGFAEGEGPPPDPKYNFLADSEREEFGVEHPRESIVNKSHARLTRGNLKKKPVGREGTQKDGKIHKGKFRDESQPGYEAWRAERNRIDEDRISRQRTAEGNWRREWDNDKTHIVDDAAKVGSRPVPGEFTKKDFDRRYHANGNDYSRGGNHRSPLHRKNYHANYENWSYNTYDQHRSTAPLGSTVSEERTVTATDKSIKVTLNQANGTKGAVLSVKVNSPSIVGTGRVGPRQRTRVTYSHSDAELSTSEIEPFYRQKSFDDKSKGSLFSSQKSPNLKRSQSQKKKDEAGSKSPYLQRKEEKIDRNSEGHWDGQREFRSSYPRKEKREGQKWESEFRSKSSRPIKRNVESVNLDSSNTSEKENVYKSDDINLDEEKLDVQDDVASQNDRDIADVAFTENFESKETVVKSKPELSTREEKNEMTADGTLNEELVTSDVGNFETKVKNIDESDNEKDCSIQISNNFDDLMNDGEGTCNLSSKEDQILAQDKLLVINESNNDIINDAQSIHDADQKCNLSKKDGQQSVIDNCDNIIKDDERENTRIENIYGSFETLTNSVIEKKKERLDEKEERNGDDRSNRATRCRETNFEQIESPVVNANQNPNQNQNQNQDQSRISTEEAK